ncbi:MAG: hypothetical protein LBS01_10795 [Prevotellaceae bacterium]|jgi:Skp family chaperone for outer membrane proteins|nr:hypothetical protein [Prevotellaceae bacterium]
MENNQNIGDVINSTASNFNIFNKQLENYFTKQEINAEIKKLEKRKLPKCIYYVWGISVFSVIISLLTIIFLHDSSNNLIALATTLIITFVGTLVTFIVVSNYAQVKDIKDDSNQKIEKFDQKLEDLQKNLDKKIEKFDQKIEDLQKNLDKKTEKFNDFQRILDINHSESKGNFYEITGNAPLAVEFYLSAILQTLNLNDKDGIYFDVRLLQSNIYRMRHKNNLSDIFRTDKIQNQINLIQNHHNYRELPNVKSAINDMIDEIHNENFTASNHN